MTMKVSVTGIQEEIATGFHANATGNDSEEESEADEDSEGEDCDDCSDVSVFLPVHA